MQTQPTPGYKAQTVTAEQDITQFIEAQDDLIRSMGKLIAKARALNSDREEIEQELAFRREHGCSLYGMRETPFQLQALLQRKQDAAKGALFIYAAKAQNLFEGMQAYESMPVTAHSLKG